MTLQIRGFNRLVQSTHTMTTIDVILRLDVLLGAANIHKSTFKTTTTMASLA
jgi:hypothetical protein